MMAGPDKAAAIGRSEVARALGAVAAGKRTIAPADERHVCLSGGEDAAIRCRADVLAILARRGLISRDGAMLALTGEGRAWLRREKAEGDPFQDQHRDIGAVQVELPGGRAAASINLAESPLGQLARRKDRAGRPFLTEAEFDAGEKLRADYTRGQMMPRISANWDAAVTTGRRGAPSSDITDIALAARIRVDAAIEAVGPELAGVLVDVCCFLKGLETVEAERGWPVRSAKVVLKAALAALGRHYDPARSHASRSRRRIVSWGGDGYRPSIG